MHSEVVHRPRRFALQVAGALQRLGSSATQGAFERYKSYQLLKDFVNLLSATRDAARERHRAPEGKDGVDVAPRRFRRRVHNAWQQLRRLGR